MTFTIYVHVANEEAIMMEVEEIPKPTDTCVIGMNPRKRDGKELHYVMSEVNTVILPWHRINFIEVMPSGEEEEIISFVRE